MEGSSNGTVHLINAFAYHRSTDDGVIWNFVNPGPFAQIRAIKTSSNYVFIGYFSSETLFYSQDAGATWAQFDLSGLNSNLIEINSHLELGRDGRVYVKTWGGADPGLYRTINPVLSVAREENIFPEEFYLHQNYPNPFNPSTTIQFSIPEQAFVKLEVFNALGEKVSTLVSEELNAGSYKFDWKAESLSSGIYYYTLTANGFTQTRKLVLLK